MIDALLDPAAAGAPFPPIHEGRYEVDPWATGLRSPVNPGLHSAVRRTGTKLLRVGLGCWLPSQDPDPSTYPDREWFTGSTLADTENPELYNWTHLDRNLEIARELDVELLFCFDYMPSTLARAGKKKSFPLYLRPFAPDGYMFPDGVREAPPREPAVFAAACVKVLEHIKEQGNRVRYVELWNEPDLPFFYSGSYAEFIAMYQAFAPAVSAAGYAVGGPSWAGALDKDEWLTAFLHDCKAHQVPLDFYSFHRYDEVVSKVLDRCHEVRKAMDDAGFAEAELLLDEWGYDLRQAPYFGTVGNAAFTASCLMQFPAAGISAQTHILLVDPIADPSLGRWHGLTRQDGDPNPITFCMEAFETFQSTPRRILTAHDDVLLAGVDDTGTRLTVLLANASKKKPMHVALRVAGSGSATVQHLTQASFDATGTWTPTADITIGDAPLEVELVPESLTVVAVQLNG